MHGSPALNPYLSGNFAPVRSEDDFDLEIVGEFPADLAGTYYRNGPNPQFEPRGHYHWFTGDGMIHGFLVEAGKVSYRNRYARRSGSLSTPLAKLYSVASTPGSQTHL
jgi:carotenoid cleavage dioxygenase